MTIYDMDDPNALGHLADLLEPWDDDDDDDDDCYEPSTNKGD
jgi:hypothetical protein